MKYSKRHGKNPASAAPSRKRTNDQGGQAGDDTPADPVHVRAVSRTEARRRVPVLFPTPAYRCRLRRTSGHATAAAGQAVKTKTYFSFRVDVWDDLRNDRAEGVSVIRIARQCCGK